MQFHARVLAAAIDAGQTIRAVRIGGTLGLMLYWGSTLAIGHWIAQRHLLRADTVGHMVARVALRVLCARRIFSARINATAVSARATIGTVVIRSALYAPADLEGITFHSRGASAVGLVVVCVAFGRDRTRVTDQARVNTLAVEALLVGAALVVRRALSLDATRLGVTRVARLARAHAVVVHDATIRILAAQAWAAAQTIDAGLGWQAV